MSRVFYTSVTLGTCPITSTSNRTSHRLAAVVGVRCLISAMNSFAAYYHWRRMAILGFAAFLANAILFIVNPWMFHVGGFDLHFIAAVLISVFVATCASRMSKATCPECGAKLIGVASSITGMMIFQKPVKCRECKFKHVGNDT